MPHSSQSGKSHGLPPEVVTLLAATDDDSREEAWRCFVHRFSRLLLHAAHERSNGYDDAMDRYAFVLQALREDEHRRLRAFDPNSGARFSTWLVVVAGRLCIDYYRKRYGTANEVDGDWRVLFRRRLVDLVPARVELAHLQDRQPHLDRMMRETQLLEGLRRALEILPSRDRMLLRLRFHDDLSAREIADLMDFPTLFHVYRHLKKVLERIREHLEASGIRDGRP